MTRILLDTQAVLLWTTCPDELPDRVVALLEDPATLVLISAASLWELSIKAEIGKLQLPEGYLEALLGSSVRFLAMTEAHGLAAGRLPPHHRDPFDRMLVAQAQAERVPLVGSDAAFAAYDVRVIW